jgi:cytochrome c peroxidase
VKRISASLVAGLLAGVAAAQDLGPPPVFPEPDLDRVRLGQQLFYDPILSGNRNISCATCHQPARGGGDGLSLGIGEGGRGLGPDRSGGSGADRIGKRVPRNAPGLWNLGHRSVRALFADGRLETSDLYGNGFASPAEEWLPARLDGILAAQALFPMAAEFEMAGNPGENDVAGAVYDRIDAPWPIIARRVKAVPGYGDRFVAAFDEVARPADVTIVQIANALGAFLNAAWRSYDSPFDDFLSGRADALDAAQLRGMRLFYGRAGCDSCHSGPLLSDQGFHALALPPFGPGRTRPFDPAARDLGRVAETDRLEDAYRFRTPSLRNVALTAPYGHNGAYPDLAGIIAHHADPLTALDRWRPEMAALPDLPWLAATDFVVMQDRREMARHRRALDIRPMALSAAEIADLVAFMGALTGRAARNAPPAPPAAVSSELPVE